MTVFSKISAEDMAKIDKYEYKRGINYTRPGDKSYNITLAFAFVIWLFMAAMVTFYVIGYLLGIRDGGNLPDNPYKWDAYFITMFTVYLIMMLTPFVYLAVSIISHFAEGFKHSAAFIKVAMLAVNIIVIPILFVQFAMISKIDGIPLSNERITDYDPGYFGLHKFFYWRHALPMIAVFIMFGVLVYIFFNDRVNKLKTYKKIAEKEYKPQFSESGEQNKDDNDPGKKSKEKNTGKNKTRNSVSVTPLKCPCCGANLMPSQEKCEFCGTFIILSENNNE